ncbi:hypothetical protein [Sporolactobacillus vineae]|uniref:hypothetical protein n=1 Tax=Sporolactobacillus vineae TaxID=444463 RepID=UPI00028A1F13|nr:hypothetical protein [Sporolactobacillus vineae]
MIAEIHNKISQTGSNLSDRLEDNLTGDFFGTLRYLPFEKGSKYVLATAQFHDKDANNHWKKFINSLHGYPFNFQFWKRIQNDEIDLLLTSERAVIGIEVKLDSMLSSEDEDTEKQTDYIHSQNQLARYSEMIEKHKKDRQGYLLFIAPFNTMKKVRTDIYKRRIIAPSIQLGFMNWQDVYEALKNPELTTNLNQGENLIISDLKKLLHKKELYHFHGFSGFGINGQLTEHWRAHKTYVFTPRHMHLNWEEVHPLRKDDFYEFSK